MTAMKRTASDRNESDNSLRILTLTITNVKQWNQLKTDLLGVLLFEIFGELCEINSYFISICILFLNE